jgi:DNA (cytosine-5)-methyltransferase 1
VSRLPELGPDGDRAYLRSAARPQPIGGPRLQVVDLFAGCGGMTLGAVEAGRSLGYDVGVVLAMELDEEVRKIYDANFQSKLSTLRADVSHRFDGPLGAALTFREQKTRREVGDVDLLLGGPPCQGHSNLNNHTRRTDPKNSLYLRMLRAVEVLEPRAVIIENVPDVRHATNRAVSRSISKLRALGYQVEDPVVSAAQLGVPQLRTRHALVAARDVKSLSASLLETHPHAKARTLRWAIGDLVDETRDSILCRASKLSAENERRARYLHEQDEFDLPNPLRPECHRAKPDHRYKSMYGRLRWDQPAQTITTGFGSPGQGRYLHPSRLRTLTPHEAARIQFFPDWFDFSSARHRRVLADCIGNAVPPKMAFALVRLALHATRGAAVPSQAPTHIAL